MKIQVFLGSFLITLYSLCVQDGSDWIFLRRTDRADLQAATWRIKDKRLELKIDSIDSMAKSSFSELIKKAKGEGMPYILLGLRKGDFYNFYDGSQMAVFGNKWQDPVTQEVPDVIEIFVIGNDDKLTYLGYFQQQNLKDLFLIQKNGDYVLSDLFQTGSGLRAKIAYAFAFQAQTIIGGDDLGTLNIYKRMMSRYRGMLQGDPKPSISDRYKISEILNELERRIKKLTLQENIQIAEILLQYARQWFVWALENLESNTNLFNWVQAAISKIPYKPELLLKEIPEFIEQPQSVAAPSPQTLLAKKPEPTPSAVPQASGLTEGLVDSLQNLTRSLLRLVTNLA